MCAYHELYAMICDAIEICEIDPRSSVKVVFEHGCPFIGVAILNS